MSPTPVSRLENPPSTGNKNIRFYVPMQLIAYCTCNFVIGAALFLFERVPSTNGRHFHNRFRGLPENYERRLQHHTSHWPATRQDPDTL